MPHVLFAGLCVLIWAFAPHAAAQPAREPSARVIVMFKPQAKLLHAPSAAQGTSAARAEVLSKRLGVDLAGGAEISDRMQVVVAQGIATDALASRLSADADVLFAVPDRRRFADAAPNDPLYPQGVRAAGPDAGQWYLRAPAGDIASSIDVERAWAVTTGSPGIVVAVLDTGVRFDHPDLRPVDAGGNLLPGYDMIALPSIANDGDGRDADASDPGDWISSDDLAPGAAFESCERGRSDSSWHGTKVSGLIAALTDNGFGMASVARNVRVLPVRVLGKCGGYDSDILAGMRWAAGLPVPGVPANPTPARVINMSLGSATSCSRAYSMAVEEVHAAGAVVVASAGNRPGYPTGTPGSCPGVIAVAALRHTGTKVGFSSLGADVALSAPGGNCVNVAPGAQCLYPILTSADTGATTPVAPTFTDGVRISVGTSFSAPLVSGTVALMFAARPSLSPSEVRAVLQGTTRPFVAGGDLSVPACAAPTYDAAGEYVVQLECRCTTSTCGAGMLDAGAAVRAAQAGVQIVTAVEYYNAALDHYFVTWLPTEIAALDAGTVLRGWTRTDLTVRTYATPASGTSPVCRYYIPPAQGDSHFYGRGLAECEATGRDLPALVLEDARFMHFVLPTAGTCPADTVAVYRVFSNRADANHRYTTDRAERDRMVARGWLAEGDGPDLVVMCAPR